jgi:molybdate transport system ATP-binding protein
VLHGVNWTVRPGEHWLVTGNNGAGKSTLAEAVAGRHRVTGGQRSWPGLTGERSRAIRLISFTDTGRLFHSANAVHYYQQRFNAFDADGHLTVREYLMANGHDEASAHKALSQLHAADLLDMERIKLSSGQTRKLLLAKALAGQPEILVIDNPYLGLDAASRSRLNAMLDDLVADSELSLILVGMTATLPSCITHHLHLEAGSVAFEGNISDDVPLTPQEQVAAKSIDDIVRHFQATADTPDYEQVLQLEDVSVAYGDKVVFDNLNWLVKTGEKWVVSGNNGSGKSTLLSLIYADHPQAYANRIHLFGRRRGRGESIWDIKRRIGFTSPELHAFFDGSLTAREVLLSGLNDTFQPPKTITSEQEKLLQALLRFSGPDTLSTKPFRQFSTGEQRLLLLLRALIKAPQVLLLDEPFQGLDAATIARCRRLLDAVLTSERTLIFISHFRAEVPEGVGLELGL